MTVDRFSLSRIPVCKLTRCPRHSRYGHQLLVFVQSPGAERPNRTPEWRTLKFKTCIGLLATSEKIMCRWFMSRYGFSQNPIH